MIAVTLCPTGIGYAPFKVKTHNSLHVSERLKAIGIVPPFRYLMKSFCGSVFKVKGRHKI